MENMETVEIATTVEVAETAEIVENVARKVCTTTLKSRLPHRCKYLYAAQLR